MSKIMILGSNGMVGSAVGRALGGKFIPASREDVDLQNTESALNYATEHCPDVIVNCAAHVGGIKANMEDKAGFLADNALLGLNAVRMASLLECRLINLGSSCIYPRDCPQPIREEYLLTGTLEPTNEGYAIAKIMTAKLAGYMGHTTIMPCNLYGPRDSFHPSRSHVIPGMLLKFYHAKEANEPAVLLWGTGRPQREFMHVDDLAELVLRVINYNGSLPPIINAGSGHEVSIDQLAKIVADVTEYRGFVQWDHSMPDGTPRKVMDSTLALRLFHWRAHIGLRAGIEQVYSENFK